VPPDLTGPNSAVGGKRGTGLLKVLRSFGSSKCGNSLRGAIERHVLENERNKKMGKEGCGSGGKRNREKWELEVYRVISAENYVFLLSKAYVKVTIYE